jgi:hypothetical protein
MNTDQIVNLVVAVLTGLAACIPLAVKLVQYVQKATQEKNWGALLGLVVDLMEEAEVKFADGATRKEWVMAMVQTSAEYINYPLDTEALSELIDALCDMTKVVNPPADEEQSEGDTEQPAIESHDTEEQEGGDSNDAG